MSIENNVNNFYHNLIRNVQVDLN